ncbi:hypothetical protein C8R47DRAFT_1094689 [Mycena vitilis]|nr:hypothetical protein C8R47DRAFT_1094689 [Mycena vitilis]
MLSLSLSLPTMKKFHTTGATPFPRTPHPPSGSTLSNATTPLKHKIKSYTALNTPRLIKDNMDPMLKNELGTSQLKDVPDLVPVLFPDACLPLPPSDIFKALSTGPSALHDGKAWVGCPNLARASFKGDVERELVDFLHVLRDRIMKICEEAGKPLPQEKGWTAKFADHGVEAAPNVRKPDLLFGGEEWPDVDVHGELKSNDDSHTRGKALEQLLNGAYLMFSSQDDRRFVVSIAFMAYNIRLHVFDRAGLVATAPFHLHKEPEMFVRVLVGLMLNNDPAVLGYDTSITKTGDHRFIEVDGIQYQIIKTLFISDVVRGRGTVCWHARHGGKDFVIKDTWADDSRTHIEAEILRMAEDVEGVPKVVADVIVKVNGVEGNTHTLRSNISKLDDSIETRVHRRLVLTPFGNPLCTFATQKELISIFIDAITAHRDLYEKTKILHRDISLNNILLVPSSQPSDRADFPPTPLSLVATSSTTQAPCPAKPASSDPPAPSPRRGLLIDMDYALVLNSEGERGPVAVGHRTGTLPFMAVDVLCASGVLVAHEPCHDLESFLYVLIWICVHYAGPGDVERQNFDVRNSPMSGWVVGNEYLNIGNAKDSALRHPKHWVPQVLNCFAPYFEPLKPCASAWRQLYVDSNLTYDAVLDVLRTTFASLEDVESWSKESDPEGYGDGKKRKRLARITEEGQEPDANDARAQKAGRSGIDHVHVHSDPTGYREKLRQRRPPGKSSLQQS